MVDDIIHLGLVDDAEIELDRAALEIAALDHPQADLAAYLDLIDEMAEHLHARASRGLTPAQQAAHLARVLGGEFGFDGDRETYDDPANADLMSVIDRRRGLPVTLAILYVSLARRLGWSAHALNTPGHVLVGLGQRPPLILDPFSRGTLIGPGDASLLRLALGRLAAFAPQHVAPMSNRAVLVRLLMNQATRAERAEQHARALVVLERITAVAPGYSFGWWERARLERASGDTAGARHSLSALLETTRDPDLRKQATSALGAMSG
jgi:regulator of sirC expression with transglutaminase-like and TPR domain